MPSVRQPRSGSLQFWPRKRAKRSYARIRNLSTSEEPGLLGFAGYKVGMARVLAIETSKYSHKKGEEISIPVTVMECPPLKIVLVRFYGKVNSSLKVKKEVLLSTKEKELVKKIKVSSKKSSANLEKIDLEKYEDIRILVRTQPILTSLGKKKPEIFELSLGGTIDDKFKFVKENQNKEIYIDSFVKDGEVIDLKTITKGKGFQGPVKRFGISIRQAKSEKSIRNPGSLGPWKGQGHIMWRVAHAGKMGYHQRTEHNKQVLKIITDLKEINQKSGWLNYGVIKNQCVLVKGSIGGAKKRLVIFQKPIRGPKKPKSLPTIQNIFPRN